MTATSSLFFLLLLLLLLPSALAGGDLFTLVYKGCADQTLPSSGVPQQSLAALSSALVSRAATSHYFRTTTSSSPSLSGLFQCRGDLSPSDCSACVRRLPSFWSSACGQAVAARVHLVGCYGLYEVSGFPQVSGTKMLYKVCSRSSEGGVGFEERRGTALAGLKAGAGKGKEGFYETSFEKVDAMAQCEGVLSEGDCGECVAEAVQKVEAECGRATAGGMYLSRCYITYGYFAKGVPTNGEGGRSGQLTGKTVAIVVGGAAGLGFVVICLLFVRSLFKRKDGY